VGAGAVAPLNMPVMNNNKTTILWSFNPG